MVDFLMDFEQILQQKKTSVLKAIDRGKQKDMLCAYVYQVSELLVNNSRIPF